MTAPFQGIEVDRTEFPAGTIRVHRAGASGPPVVLLHGGGLDNAMLSWRRCVPALAADYHVYAPDFPGQGGSMPWHGRGDQRTLEEVLRWLLDTWEVSEVVLVGLSIGASVAIGFALRHPRRVRGLVLLGSAGLQQRLDRHLLQYASVRTGIPGRLLVRLVRLNRSLARGMLVRTVFSGDRDVPDLETIVDDAVDEARVRSSVFTDWQRASTGRRSMTVNHLPRLEQLRCPTMLVHGERDTVVPVSVAREAAAVIPGAALRILPDAGHWAHRQRPAEFHSLVREFVDARQ